MATQTSPTSSIECQLITYKMELQALRAPQSLIELHQQSVWCNIFLILHILGNRSFPQTLTEVNLIFPKKKNLLWLS
jgi:hypothetical protein